MHVHIELSSVCMLKCTQCLRVLYATELADQLNKFMDYKKICNFIKENILNIQYIYVCGTLGENIIHPKFLIIMRYFTYLINKYKLNTRIIIKTNGEINDLRFWKKLKNISDKIDYFHVKVAIDTLYDDKYNYRNNDVNNILNIVEYYINLGGKIIWSSILLENNKDLIKKMIKKAKDIGCVGYEMKMGWENTNIVDKEYIRLKLNDMSDSDVYCENINNVFLNIQFLITPCPNITKTYLIACSKIKRNLALTDDEYKLYDIINMYKKDLTYFAETNTLQTILKSEGYLKIKKNISTLSLCANCFNNSTFVLYF